ncbi:MAG TPA: Gmad2 immunoglobulin-like domain-containing protein [Candidatus Paceibacterota bacterium]|jgi:hypothetical protein
MNTNTRTAAIIGLIILVAIAIYAFASSNERKEEVVAEPMNFTECAERYPVMESYPRRCVSPSGVQFVETVATTTAPAPTPTTPTTPAQPQTSGIPNLITVSSPTRDQKVSSPLTVTGQARGTWYFEASFPVELRDTSGRLIAQGPAQAQGEWMTENFVPFRASLTYPAQPAGSKGTLILRKDNPSGDPARDQSVSIPVTF